jgi:hypothetical protein
MGFLAKTLSLHYAMLAPRSLRQRMQRPTSRKPVSLKIYFDNTNQVMSFILQHASEALGSIR